MEIKITFPNVFLLCFDVKSCSQNYFKPFCGSTAECSFSPIISLCVTLCSMTFCFVMVCISWDFLNFSFTTNEMEHDYYYPVFLTKWRFCQCLWKKLKTRCWTFPTMHCFRWNLNLTRLLEIVITFPNVFYSIWMWKLGSQYIPYMVFCGERN